MKNYEHWVKKNQIGQIESIGATAASVGTLVEHKLIELWIPKLKRNQCCSGHRIMFIVTPWNSIYFLVKYEHLYRICTSQIVTMNDAHAVCIIHCAD